MLSLLALATPICAVCATYAAMVFFPAKAHGHNSHSPSTGHGEEKEQAGEQKGQTDNRNIIDVRANTGTSTGTSTEAGTGANIEANTEDETGHSELTPHGKHRDDGKHRDLEEYARHGNQTAPADIRERTLLEAANAISVMLFSNSFESFEVGAKALGIMGTAIGADFTELWKNQGEKGTTSSTLVCWWEKEDQKTHLMETKTLAYKEPLVSWLENLRQNTVLHILRENAPPLVTDLAHDNTASFLVTPIFYEGVLWGFLRLGLGADVRPFTENEHNILRSIGLFLVASLQRYRTQDALKASEDRFRDVTLATGEIVWELDANGFFSYISTRITEVAGYPHQDLIGKRWEEISPATYNDVTSQFFQTAITENLFNNFEHAIVTKDGETLWLHSAAKLLVDSVGVAGLRGTSFNYTKTRETAHQLENTLQALQRSNFELEQAVQHAYTLAEKANSANTAKQNFLANVSHEIRTPLNSIAGMVYLIEQTHPTEKQQTYVTQIKDASATLVTIVDNILNFTNLQTGTAESVLSRFLLTDFFKETSTFFSEKLAHKNLRSVFAIASNVPIDLKGDVASLRQIITNLLDNAIKFTDSGAVALTCSFVKQRKSSDIILRFTIRDTGIGIPKNQQEEMLEAFTQKDASSTRRFGGTGLGLTIAHQLVSLNGGEFSLESTPSEGTVIHFTFAFQSPANGQLRHIPASPYRNMAVIIEDFSNSHFLVSALEDVNFTVTPIHFSSLATLGENENSLDIFPNTSKIADSPKEGLSEPDEPDEPCGPDGPLDLAEPFGPAPHAPDRPNMPDELQRDELQTGKLQLNEPQISGGHNRYGEPNTPAAVEISDTPQTPDAASLPDALSIIGVPSTIFQKYPQLLEDFFSRNPEIAPMVVAFTHQLYSPIRLPEYITHFTTGPLLTFVPPNAVDALKGSANTALSQGELLSKKQQRTLQEQIDTIIALLKDSDAEGRLKFNDIKVTLGEIDEKATGEIGKFLDIFQFAEAIPLLMTLKKKIAHHGE